MKSILFFSLIISLSFSDVFAINYDYTSVYVSGPCKVRDANGDTDQECSLIADLAHDQNKFSRFDVHLEIDGSFNPIYKFMTPKISSDLLFEPGTNQPVGEINETSLLLIDGKIGVFRLIAASNQSSKTYYFELFLPVEYLLVSGAVKKI